MLSRACMMVLAMITPAKMIAQHHEESHTITAMSYRYSYMHVCPSAERCTGRADVCPIDALLTEAAFAAQRAQAWQRLPA